MRVSELRELQCKGPLACILSGLPLQSLYCFPVSTLLHGSQVIMLPCPVSTALYSSGSKPIGGRRHSFALDVLQWWPPCRDYEACLLRLIEKITNGCEVEIDETGEPAALRERYSGFLQDLYCLLVLHF